MEAWLKDAGAVGLHHLKVAEFALTGRGVQAQRAFSTGERILTIPAQCLWTVEHAYADRLLGPVLRGLQPPLSVEDTLALYILLVRARPDDVAYEGRRSHVDVLPDKYTMSIFFSDEEMQSKFGIEDYKWALCTVWSRGMDFTVSEGNSLRLLAPFADMLNHSSEVKQCHAYDPTTGDLSILASKDYNVGDQVFIYYGPVPNNRLLRLYGFVLPENPHDSYDLVLQTSPMAPLYEQKERLWKLAGLETACTVPLTANDPLPRSVLRYLRIQRLDESFLGAMTMQIATGTDEKISDDSEMQILQFLIDSISAILESFSIPLEILTAQLSAGDVYPVGGNAWAAAQVSAGEQRILRLARDKAERLLSAVGGDHGDVQRRDRCARCGKDEEAAAATATRLMACGRCKAVQYCGRECQVGHFKEHKALCRSLTGKK